jgi:hypothetical protein
MFIIPSFNSFKLSIWYNLSKDFNSESMKHVLNLNNFDLKVCEKVKINQDTLEQSLI